MVAARHAFLGAGHFDGLAELIAAAGPAALAAVPVPGCVADLGAGSGFYLARVLDREPERVGIAVDLAKPALRRAARAHPRIAAVAADVWGALPLRSGSAALVLDVFSPRNPAEIERVLAPAGALLVATPNRHHLAELVEALGLVTVDPDKEDRLAHQLAAFRLEAEEQWEETLSLGHGAIANLVAMGPSAHHAAPGLGKRIETLPDPMPVTASVRVATYRR